MEQASSAEVARNFGKFREMADGSRGPAEAVMVMHYNKPSVVIVAADEYERLKRRDKRVMATEELPEWLIERIAGTEMDARFAYLDDVD